MENAGIDESILSQWSQSLFKKAVDSLTATTISAERLRSVEEIKDFLHIPDADVPDELLRVNRWNYILQIREGLVPPVEVCNLMLHKGEVAYWVQPSRLWEHKVVSRRYEGGHSGISFRIARGITIRTGGSRGQLVTDSADVPIADGDFILTSRRFVFRSKAKSFETKYEKLLDVQNYVDGIRYSESNKQKPRSIQYLSPNGDIIIEILSKILSGIER